MYRNSVIFFIFWSFFGYSQTFSVQEAINYAHQNHANIKNAQLDVEIAKAKVQEVKAIGLPQINAQIAYSNNLIVPRFFIPARTFDPKAGEGDVVAAKFGVNNNGDAAVTLTQLLFDGSYLIGLKATQLFVELSQKNVRASKEQVAENVMKAYYNVLINEDRLALFRANRARLDSVVNQTKIAFSAGFVEKIDVQRLEIQQQNVKTELQNAEKLQILGYDLLKFQMGYPLSESIVLTEKWSESSLSETFPQETGVGQRTDYALLEMQKKISGLELKNNQAAYLPRLVSSLNYGYRAGYEAFGDLVKKEWFQNSALNIALQIPIFDSFSKRHKISQTRNTISKINNTMNYLESAIQLQQKQACLQLQAYQETLRENKSTIQLAEEVLKVTRLKYSAGVGTNLEVVTAETSLKEAQTNYFNTLFNVMMTKVELKKAYGILLEK